MQNPTQSGLPAATDPVLHRMTGCPVAHLKNSLTAGPHGPVALQDIDLIEKIGHFVREKIPARNVHALGHGAYGTLTVTNAEISQRYSFAKVFTPGSVTPLFCRMSGVFTEQGDPDTTRDLRGMALKFYTTDGNWDLLCINTPVFNARDMKVGPDAVHSLKRDPRNGQWNPTQTWDFISWHPEALHQTLMIYTDRVGTPLSFRYMNAFACNTFSFLNQHNVRTWVKFHLVSQLGCRGMNVHEAKLIAGEDPNFLGRDLHEAIGRGQFPRWRFACQVMQEEEGYKRNFAFDCTKVWPHAQYPLIDIGLVELNRNVTDYFAEVEQVAFSPATVVPGISFSPDKLLQGRMLVYDDAQFHRLGPNFKQLPINRPVNLTATPLPQYGGQGQMEIRKNVFPHYAPSNFAGQTLVDTRARPPPFICDGPVDFYDLPGEGSDADYFAQSRLFVNKCLSSDERASLCINIAISLEKVTESVVLTKVLDLFRQFDARFCSDVERLLQERRNRTALQTEGEQLWHRLNTELGITPRRDYQMKEHAAMMEKQQQVLKMRGDGGQIKMGGLPSAADGGAPSSASVSSSAVLASAKYVANA